MLPATPTPGYKSLSLAVRPVLSTQHGQASVPESCATSRRQGAPQPVGQLPEHHYPRMAGQPSLTKADVEFADLSDYSVSVHLLGASFRQDGALFYPRFCQERRHFSILEEFPPPLLPVDSGKSIKRISASWDELKCLHGLYQNHSCDH